MQNFPSIKQTLLVSRKIWSLNHCCGLVLETKHTQYDHYYQYPNIDQNSKIFEYNIHDFIHFIGFPKICAIKKLSQWQSPSRKLLIMQLTAEETRRSRQNPICIWLSVFRGLKCELRGMMENFGLVWCEAVKDRQNSHRHFQSNGWLVPEKLIWSILIVSSLQLPILSRLKDMSLRLIMPLPGHIRSIRYLEKKLGVDFSYMYYFFAFLDDTFQIKDEIFKKKG